MAGWHATLRRNKLQSPFDSLANESLAAELSVRQAPLAITAAAGICACLHLQNSRDNVERFVWSGVRRYGPGFVHDFVTASSELVSILGEEAFATLAHLSPGRRKIILGRANILSCLTTINNNSALSYETIAEELQCTVAEVETFLQPSILEKFVVSHPESSIIKAIKEYKYAYDKLNPAAIGSALGIPADEVHHYFWANTIQMIAYKCRAKDPLQFITEIWHQSRKLTEQERFSPATATQMCVFTPGKVTSMLAAGQTE